MEEFEWYALFLNFDDKLMMDLVYFGGGFNHSTSFLVLSSLFSLLCEFISHEK